ncbi:MAG TPA: hypothetical protein VFR35_09570, partial [Actinoplanes sp.]|nr:hypothetical protein [Actinoplanes sp.]
MAAENRNGAVPQPRDPAERPVPHDQDDVARANARRATGTARPVTGSASVPGLSRAPIAREEFPPPTASPQSRGYGRATSPQADDAPHRNTEREDALRGGDLHSGHVVDSTREDTPRDSPTRDDDRRETGPPETGPREFGLPETGSRMSGPRETGPRAFGSPETGPPAFGSPETGPRAFGSPETGPPAFGSP